MKKSRVPSLRDQLLGSMADLKSIMDGNQSLSGNGRFTIRTIEIEEPQSYDASSVEATRAKLNVSQSVFARMLGVSDALVRSWERGARQPAPIACRLLDQMRRHPEQFRSLIKPVKPRTSR